MADTDYKKPGCNDVTEASGYTIEAKVPSRNSNGWGETQTRLPVGHLARRDTPPVRKSMKAQ